MVCGFDCKPSDCLALIGVEYAVGRELRDEPSSVTTSITLSEGGFIPASRDATGTARKVIGMR
jgi:hypothetical protein